MNTSTKVGQESTITKEIWKDIVGYEGIYQVSSFGNVKSLDRFSPYKSTDFLMKIKGRVLKPGKNKQGYLTVALSKGKPKTYYVHDLVASHFVENPFIKNTVNHIDGQKSNNHYLNLEWNTQGENNQHAWDSGLR